MATKSETIEGTYRDGKIELVRRPSNVHEARVIVTFLQHDEVSLIERDIDVTEAASLLTRLDTFVEDWDRTEMEGYDAL